MNTINFKFQLLVLLLIAPLSIYALKSGPITYQVYDKLLGEDVAHVLECEKNVTGEIDVPYNVSRHFDNWKVVEIGDYAFQECRLSGVKLSPAIRTISAGAFYSCPNLKSVTTSNGLKFIEGSAFAQCRSLESINFPRSLKYIGDNAFYYCSSLKEVKLGEHLTHLGMQAFMYCTSLERVEFACPLTYIPDAAFNYCSSLQTITLSGNIRQIGRDAFAYSGLRNVVIGESVEYIGAGAFSTCVFLTDIYLHRATPPALENYTFNYGAPANMTLHVPAGSKEAYMSHHIWRQFGKIVEDL